MEPQGEKSSEGESGWHLLAAHLNSPKTYTQHQMFVCLALKSAMALDYRGIAGLLADCPDLRTAIKMNRSPHWTTLQKAADRLLCAAATVDEHADHDVGSRSLLSTPLASNPGMSAAISSSGGRTSPRPSKMWRITDFPSSAWRVTRATTRSLRPRPAVALSPTSTSSKGCSGRRSGGPAFARSSPTPVTIARQIMSSHENDMGLSVTFHRSTLGQGGTLLRVAIVG